MTNGPAPGGHSLDIGSLLAATEDASPVQAVEALARRLGLAFGATSVSFLILDLSGAALVRLAHVPLHAPRQDEGGRGDERGDPDADLPTPRRGEHPERHIEDERATVVPLDGGPGEQALRTQTVQVLEPHDESVEASHRWTVLAPVTHRGESLGLLELSLPSRPDERTTTEIAGFAHLLAFVVIANGRHTDLFEWGQRSRRFSLSAEIQQRLLPGPRTCEAGAFTLAGWLEPADSVGGDTFDYSLERDTLHLSMTDAMGHGVAAALTATVCMGALRGSRREGASLCKQAAYTNVAVAEHASHGAADDFATGLLGRLSLRTGSLQLVNAGHVAPYLARRGNVTALSLPVDLPFGLFPDTAYASTQLVLEPGDRVVIVTDGMIERDAATVDLPAAILDTMILHPREAVRSLAGCALEAAGHALSDDATVLCLDWHGHHDLDRATVHGADSARASAPLA